MLEQLNLLKRLGKNISLIIPVVVMIIFADVAAAGQLDQPAGALEAFRKIQCSVADGGSSTFWWNGNAYSRVPGEPDRLLFRVEGMNIRQCGPLSNDSNDAEFQLVSREILLYKDPVTGEVLRTWDNPWTGETVNVMHVANDPVNGKYGLTGRDGKPFSLPFMVSGDQWWVTSTIPLFYKNPLGGDYQKYVGGTYHVTEMFNFMGDLKPLLDPDVESVDTRVGWVRVSPWLPWMEMGDRAGLIYFHTAGRKLDSHADLSEIMKAEIEKNYPAYNEPPPLNDSRRNVTSWSYFKENLPAD